MRGDDLRAWVDVPGFPPGDGGEQTWGAVIDVLDGRYGQYGPIICGGNPCQIVLSARVANRAEMASLAARVVAEALCAAGRGDLYPAAIEIEAAED